MARMYVPKQFAPIGGDASRTLIEQRPFATFVTVEGGEPFATHLPLLFHADGSTHGVLFGHVARANPQWRHFDDGRHAMAVFNGPHAYVSPRWYTTEGQVPTWNYAVVHAYGTPRVVADDRARNVIEQIVARFENDQPQPWTMDGLGEEDISSMLRAIVVFEMPIDRLEGKWKVGQNRESVDRTSAADHLDASGDPDAMVIAGWMRDTLRASPGSPRR
ncbi:MAG: FMN-binding negative transcriptional regulator [Polyangiaceae bacterium]|nr:FMN-binding negative transcriptional regulator [Polyangiaceae bacterium]